MIPLVRSRSSRERYYLLCDGKGMGGVGRPDDHYLKQWVIVNGVDRGNGFQGYMSIDYALNECDWFPNEAKQIVRRVLNIQEKTQ